MTKSKPNTFTKKNERGLFPEVKLSTPQLEALTQATLEMILDATRLALTESSTLTFKMPGSMPCDALQSALPEHRMLDILKGVKDVHAAYLKAGEVLMSREYANH